MAIGRRFPWPSGLRTLAYGDGIGTDALRFSVANNSVDYFEFDGPSSRFALLRFRRLHKDTRIKVHHTVETIAKGEFDAVICREVLEHVTDPPALVMELRDYLVDGGIALITESFGRVEPRFPTHLLTNQPYAGKTAEMFVERGFRLLEAFPEERPFVFQKTSMDDRSRFSSLRGSRAQPLRKGIKRAGRWVVSKLPF